MKIRQRIRGEKKYYYLEHSFRKKGKVIKKEKYLGNQIPENIEDIKKEFEKEFKKDFINKLEKIKSNFQAEWKRIPKSAKKRELEEISIAFTYNTNAIEGSTITLEETREIITEKIAVNKPLRDVRETEAHSIIFLQMLEKKQEISEKLLLEWHKQIFGETKSDIAGQYRDYLVRIGPYLPPDWQDVKKLMFQFIKFLKQNKKINPVELSARAYYKFEKIHPFGDGNGRIGRLLMNYILWHSGYPMLIIEYKNRKSHNKAFTKDESGFVSYFMRRYLAIHKNRYMKN